MSLFPDEDVLTKEIETWRGFIDRVPSEEDNAVLTKLLNDCYKYSCNKYSCTDTCIPIRVFNHVFAIDSTETYRSIKVDDAINKQTTR